MKTSRVMLVALLGGVGLMDVASFAAVSVEENIVGPTLGADTARSSNPYAVSPTGARLATVIPKGSRVAVVVDGAEGPRFDAIIPPTLAYIDPRSAHAAQSLATALTPLGPGFTQTGFGAAGPVVFSRDGKRFAYLARQAQEWVLMADGKEVVRLPAEGSVSAVSLGGPTGTVDARIEFAGPEGKHLMFARSVYGGYELWVDGQKMPGIVASGGGGSEGTLDPVISRDGSRFAYLAQIESVKRALVIDGKVADYVGTDLQFSADGKTLFALARDQTGQQMLLVNGKPTIKGSGVRYFLPPVGNRFVAVVTEPMTQGQKYYLVVDGKKVDATEVSGFQASIDHVVISPDGKHHAAACKASQNVSYVVVDGKKGEHYDSIWDPAKSLTFSPDSSRVGYIAGSAGKFFVVVNDDESDAFDGLPVFAFSPDGKRVAAAGQKAGRYTLFVDRKAVGQASMIVFSPDGSRYAFATDPHKEIHLDGKPTGLSGDKFTFSPDSKHFAVFGNQPSVDPKSGVLAQFAQASKVGLFVDGQHVWGSFGLQNLRYRAFSPDSQHFFYTTEEPAIGERAGPGKFEWVTYLDGKAVARFDRESTVLGYVYTAGNYQFQQPLPAWNVGSDGVLTFLGPVDDAVKRFKVKPTSETSIATMIADAAAASEKAPAAVTGRGAPESNPTTAVTRVQRPPRPAPGATVPPATPRNAAPAAVPLPGAVTDATKKIDQTRKEIDKTKAQVKSLWDALAPKEKK